MAGTQALKRRVLDSKRRSLSDASTTGSEGEAHDLVSEHKAQRGAEEQLQAPPGLEAECGVEPSFFPAAALFCHILLLVGLATSSPAPLIALLAPSLAAASVAAACRHGCKMAPCEALLALIGIQAVAFATWSVHVAFEASPAPVCTK